MPHQRCRSITTSRLSALVLAVLAVTLPLPAHAGQELPAKEAHARALREEARQLRQASADRLRLDEAQCPGRVLETACHDAARQQHLAQELQARERDLAAGQIEREIQRERVAARESERRTVAAERTPEALAERRNGLADEAEAKQIARAAKEAEKRQRAVAYREAAARKQAIREQKAAKRARKAESRAAARQQRAAPGNNKRSEHEDLEEGAATATVPAPATQ